MTASRREHLYGLHGVYLDAYDAIVRPHRVWSVRVYTLRRWAPILGASGFWLLIALQQLCYRNQQGHWCIATREKLAEDSGVSESTVHRLLHGERYRSSGLCHWVSLRQRRVWSADAGRVVQRANRYDAALDPPLAPVDQQGLAQFLLERGVRPGVPSTMAEPALKELARKPLSELLHLLADCAARFDPPPEWSADAFLATPTEVVKALGVEFPVETEERADFLALCSEVHQALIGQTFLQSQYFRREWLPQLGPTLALTIVQLRSRCFWNEHELRDETQVYFTTLARTVGCTPQWLRHSLAMSKGARFVTVLHGGRGCKPTFKVVLREPITPADWARYQEQLTATVPPGGRAGDADTDEKQRFDRLGVSEKGAGDRLGGRDNETVERLRPPENDTPALLGTAENKTPEPHGSTIVFVNTNFERTLEKKHVVDASAATVLLLESFGIGPPSSQRIAERSTPESVRAWMLYTLTQPGLRRPDIAQGFVVNRLLKGDQPPPRFRVWAQLMPEDWEVLWRASHYGGRYRGPALSAVSRFQELEWSAEELLRAWHDDFARVFRQGPFGQELVDWAEMEERLREQLQLPGGVEMTEDGGRIVARARDAVAYEWLADHKERIRCFLKAQGIFHDLRLVEAPRAGSPADPGVAGGESSDVWQSVLEALKRQMTRATFETCLDDSRLMRREEQVLVVRLGSPYARDWVEARLKPLILDTVQRVIGRSLEVQFVVAEE